MHRRKKEESGCLKKKTWHIIYAICWAGYLSGLVYVVLFKASWREVQMFLERLGGGGYYERRRVYLRLFESTRFFLANWRYSYARWNVLGNVLLFLPFGMLNGLTWEGRKGLFFDMCSAGGVSLCFEFIQFLYSIGEFDVDDIMLNIMGALAGYGAVRVFDRRIGKDCVMSWKSRMRMEIYHFLVNRHSGIRERYHRYHDRYHGWGGRLLSYAYLLGLNLAYCLGGRKELDMPEAARLYENKKLLLKESESAKAFREHLSVEEYVEKLSAYDVISFDIFDTMIFRPFSEPGDLFYFLGAELGILDFKRIRMEQEALVRGEWAKIWGRSEVTLSDIWERMERETGISAEIGQERELDLEERFCFANPFMLEVFRRLLEKGKRMIAVSDMYLPSCFLDKLLMEKGFEGVERLYVSCEAGCGKADGGLFGRVKRDFKGFALIHVGDNAHSDVRMAEKNGIAALFYSNVNREAFRYRSWDMSPVIGGAYRGIVGTHIYQGRQVYSMEYEYGFIYGGLFVTGYCGFIHEYCRKNQVDKLLFLSRDGDILKQAYDRMYPQEETAYVYLSRTAAVKLMAEYNRYDYFKRFLSHKVNRKKTVREVLEAMDAAEMEKYLDLETGGAVVGGEELTSGNVELVKGVLLAHFEEIVEGYRELAQAAEAYYRRILTGRRHACVDIGWAGSGALALSYLAERVWKLPCEVKGILAGTNTIHNGEPDAGEAFLQSGRLTAYLFSQALNRDVMKKHDLNRNYNLYWELLVSSPERRFTGFCFEEGCEEGGTEECIVEERNGCGIEESVGEEGSGREAGECMREEGKRRRVKLCFGEEERNKEGIMEIQRGILDFVEEYYRHFQEFPQMFRISGRDACAPMLLAAGKEERYLKEIAKRFPDFFAQDML